MDTAEREDLLARDAAGGWVECWRGGVELDAEARVGLVVAVPHNNGDVVGPGGCGA
jgi:hypothetical protein